MNSKLDITKDYIITKKYPLDSFHTPDIPILSVFKGTKSKLAMDNVFTPKEYLSQAKGKKLLLLYEPELIVSLDYLDTINELRRMGHNFIAYTDTTEEFSYLSNPTIYCINQEFHIKAVDNEKYYFLYHICKNRLFDGSVYIYAEKYEYKRIEILLGAFLGAQVDKSDTQVKYKNNITLSSNVSIQFYNNVLVFGDKKIGMHCDRMINVCEKSDFTKYAFDYNKVRNEKYRLDDLIRNLTKNVLNGKKKIDLSRFASLRCD